MSNKKPFFRTAIDEGHNVSLVAIDGKDEKNTVKIADLTEKGLMIKEGVKNKMEEKGYDVSFTDWDEEGSVKIFK